MVLLLCRKQCQQLRKQKDFMTFLEQYETIIMNQITTLRQFENLIDNARKCDDRKRILIIYDSKRCSPIGRNSTNDNGVGNDDLLTFLSRAKLATSYSQLHVPSNDTELNFELFQRLQHLPSMVFCQLVVILQNAAYTSLVIDGKDADEIRTKIEMMKNEDCLMVRAPDGNDGWRVIREALNDIEKIFLKEENLSKELEWKFGCIMVGTTGGIAVVALAISIFWGLNGSSFVTK
ncbi:unnamed protein product [Anisakis simplex]|uniref:UPF0481 protein At3g02645 n=1 Tax=Anisakis simplex TaxID=6269 RepID=A0A0M3JSV5_ANISI|nr:unnamed protein product [Anisakis simplex]